MQQPAIQGSLQRVQQNSNQSYGHPIIEPSTHRNLQVFSKVCSTGDLESVTVLAAGNHAPNNAYYLNFGLVSAIIHRQIDIVRYLLSCGAAIDDSVTAMAVKAASLPVFEILLSHGWDVNASFMGGQTALLNLLKHDDLIRWLLAHGANPNLGPPSSPQPRALPVTDSGAVLDTAASIASPEVFGLLLQRGAKLEISLPLHAAAASASKTDDESIAMMEYLLQLGVDIDGSDEARGFRALGTPLHYAIRGRMMDRVKFLLMKGSDVKAAGQGGVTALMLAKQTGKEELVALIENCEKDGRAA
ncbi:MAG: hypothetical protein ASARMPRED_007180 [Alectoria sarmentosa]|nr:MAG: hypothetical protein ASARMPRED_007180 [Alectoria sarmentosa]